MLKNAEKNLWWSITSFEQFDSTNGQYDFWQTTNIMSFVKEYTDVTWRYLFLFITWRYQLEEVPEGDKLHISE